MNHPAAKKRPLGADCSTSYDPRQPADHKKNFKRRDVRRGTLARRRFGRRCRIRCCAAPYAPPTPGGSVPHTADFMGVRTHVVAAAALPFAFASSRCRPSLQMPATLDRAKTRCTSQPTPHIVMSSLLIARIVGFATSSSCGRVPIANTFAARRRMHSIGSGSPPGFTGGDTGVEPIVARGRRRFLVRRAFRSLPIRRDRISPLCRPVPTAGPRRGAHRADPPARTAARSI